MAASERKNACSIITDEDEDEDIIKYRNAERSAGCKNDDAKKDLAWFLLTGRGGAKIDENRALALLNECSMNNDCEAMWMLGLCFEFGKGIEQNIKEAQLYYQRSDAGGNAIGQYLAHRTHNKLATGKMEVESLFSQVFSFNNVQRMGCQVGMNRLLMMQLPRILSMVPWTLVDLRGFFFSLKHTNNILQRLYHDKETKLEELEEKSLEKN